MEPILLWYETINKVSIVLDLDNISNPEININETFVSVKVDSEDKTYNMKINLLHPIDIEKSSHTNFRKLRLILIKQTEQMWEQLNQTSKNNSKIRIDWENYTNEQENMDSGESNISDGLSEDDTEDSYRIDENNISLSDLIINELNDKVESDDKMQSDDKLELDDKVELTDNGELEEIKLDESGDIDFESSVMETVDFS